MNELLLSYIDQNQAMNAFLAMKQLYEELTGDLMSMDNESIALAGQACFQGRDPEAMSYWLEQFAQMLPQEELVMLLSDPQAVNAAAIRAMQTTPEKMAAIKEAEESAMAQAVAEYEGRLQSGDPEALQGELFRALFDRISALKIHAKSPQEILMLDDLTGRLFKADEISDLQAIEKTLARL